MFRQTDPLLWRPDWGETATKGFNSPWQLELLLQPPQKLQDLPSNNPAILQPRDQALQQPLRHTTSHASPVLQETQGDVNWGGCQSPIPQTLASKPSQRTFKINTSGLE
mmetsp:Transcript_36828/g.59664  ORF Transcript_36828/g.59664 Transcript_36828/m.59664 type:complete len:109 (+) Transcript_36828:1755-2081(+)